ncbi:type-1 angiotensin II receptor-associated protein isoform X1 [Tribolium castaneum]|uniref:Type-1 angiotensin II receptor-associated protein-like Protein n=1 Tax=Tribolium castaneum TaxID=7070 RepID=A0A139WDJ8_TRICA|nr:PREDICTED: type-1 angiotensin II receptor-associated protein isoform X1 [Tribolium castaneum]KYB25937.1 Type-1 angiotensin II receptor-associated protein-like Protein [Tribolium castaneum]|eukprot:XP_008197152.1 PREDICTED: type-1 angiotensin II receptor-associated protein isoform X1 [Tribolium castaneum]
MPALPQIRNLNLKVIFLSHFVFIALSSMGFWSTSAYLFYNFFFIIFLVWSLIQPQNEEPLQLAIVVNGVSIFLDILLLVMSYPSDAHSAREKFSAAMCILHLIVRPFSTIVLIKNLEERTGSNGALSGLFGEAPQQSSYEDIDRNAPHTSQAASYDFSTAQQI